MAKNNFYVAKGKNDKHPWLFYGEKPPMFLNEECCHSSKCTLIGSFTDNPIANSIEDNTYIKIYIRKETKK